MAYRAAGLPLSAYNFQNNYEEEEEQGEELGQSKIVIMIKCPITITGDKNLIAVDPSLNASKISIGLIAALKQMSANGIAMYDEDGRPRPIDVTVEAEVAIEGSDNIIGEKAVLEGIKVNALVSQALGQTVNATADGPVIKKEEPEPTVSATADGRSFNQNGEKRSLGQDDDNQSKRTRHN